MAAHHDSGDMFCAVFVTTWNGNMDSNQLKELVTLIMYRRPVLVCMNKAGMFEQQGHLPTKQVSLRP